MLIEEAQPDPSEDPWLDRIVDDRYRVLARVGQGGMGVVYKVEHVRIGKVAAMKLLHRRLCGDAALLKRFRIEAEAISRLNHPNIVQVFDYGQVGEQPYLLMEYLHGEDLGLIVKRDGPLPLRRLIPLLIQVCDALTEAHELNIVHRDLKPENIQVSRTRAGLDHVKVLDFGLAKIIGDGGPSATDSVAGNLVGTPYYMSPEQIRGLPLDQRVDIYALGALTYRVITGNYAFTARTPVGVLTKHITEELVPPSRSAPGLGISSAIDGVVAKAMAKAANDRYGSVSEMKTALVEAANRSFSTEVDLSPAQEFSADSNGDLILQVRRSSDSGELEDAPTGPRRPRVATPLDVSTPARLTRADLDFERRLFRGRRVSIFIVLLLVLGAGGTAGWWFWMREQPKPLATEEIEPNNQTAQATRFGRGHPVSGKLGKRLSKSQSDLDWYRVQIDANGPQSLRLDVSAIPNIDIQVELYDQLGGLLATVDATGKGGNETLTNWPVAPGTHYVLIREVMEAGFVPTENITDSYQLKVDWRPLEEGWEREPNDSERQANRLELGATTRGFLSTPTDTDSFRVDAPAGQLEGLVSGVPGVSLAVEIRTPEDPPRTLDSEAVGGNVRLYGIKSDGKKPVVIMIRRKNRKKVSTATLPGQDRPYTLKLWKPTPAQR